VYKSTDAGKTWKKMGLDATQHISRIAIDPKNPNIVFIAAQGALYSKSSERGIYKSVDGGTTWKKVLYVDDKTGCAEISMDMHNPSIMYAAMWEHGRLPWQVISGGPGSGLYKSTDGGNNWVKMEKGLPKEMGKMSIAVSRANSEKVYALIESDFSKDAGGLYVSDDAGASWSQINKSHRLIQRAWYYIELFPDPTNENTVYVMSAPSLKSIDGGKTFTDFARTHGDYHDLWIHPSNGKNMVIADDGGAAITHDGGKSWSSQNNMPTAQFYRINVDNETPYNIYAGQQDNSSVKIASRAIGAGGIDQRKIFMASHDHIHKIGYKPNIHLMNRMIPSLNSQLRDSEELNDSGAKMSSSDSDSKIELTESVKNIRKKISKAYLGEANISSPLFEFVRHVIFPINRLLGLNSFEINRDDKWGGPIQFQSIELLISVFGENNLSPQDLKLGIADWIVNLLEPIRDHFESDEMKELVYQAYPNK